MTHVVKRLINWQDIPVARYYRDKLQQTGYNCDHILFALRNGASFHLSWEAHRLRTDTGIMKRSFIHVC